MKEEGLGNSHVNPSGRRGWLGQVIATQVVGVRLLDVFGRQHSTHAEGLGDERERRGVKKAQGIWPE